jgi:hypothetical protein
MEEKSSHEYLSDEFGKDSFNALILMVYFWSRCHIVDILHSYDWIYLLDRRSPSIMSSPMSWKKTILWMLSCSRRAIWTLNRYLVSEALH